MYVAERIRDEVPHFEILCVPFGFVHLNALHIKAIGVSSLRTNLDGMTQKLPPLAPLFSSRLLVLVVLRHLGRRSR